MGALALRLFPNASDEALRSSGRWYRSHCFALRGLLVSVSVIVLDKYIPGEWF